MNKIILNLAFIALTTSLFAQEAADKKVQGGLVAGFGINFQKMGTKLIATDGLGTDLTIGANVNFSLSETIGFNTGIEFDFETLKYKSAGENIYYRYNDSDILNKEDSGTDPNNEMFLMAARKQKATYITIPTMLLFRTKFIGYFRYFGKFGLRNSILLSSTITDQGYNFPLDINPVVETASAESFTNENMTASGEMFIFKSSVGLAGGAEWNFSGSTCLVAELGYYYGFTPLHGNKKEDKSFLYTTDITGTTPAYFSNKATQGQLMLKVSILF
ncbi:MAG: hypothetical protein JKY09_01325 [Crocinitomicaceae bacterium]|nr:hypothetical protein [Crocinitomicaceae bacterium]